MAEQRMVQTAFWYDDYVSTLTREERYFFLYLLSNPHTNIAGAYQIGMRYVTLETWFSESEVLALFARFERDGKARYENGWIAVRNWIKHQNYGSFTIRKGIEKYLAKAPEWARNYVKPIGYPYPLASEPKLESELQSELELKITSEDVTADSPPDSDWAENKGITKILEKMKSDLWIPDFKEDSRKQRLRGKHVADLLAKIGPDEFRRRWKAVLADEWKHKQCASLDFAYWELKSAPSPKAAKEAKEKKRAVSDADSRSEDERRKAEELAERERLQALFDSLDEGERKSIESEAAAELKELWISPESDAAKKRSVYRPMLRGRILSVTSRKHGG